MAGFKGQAEYSVDSKGRVAIPAKMRSAMNAEAGDAFTATRGFENCIFLYPMDGWRKKEEEIGSLNMYSRDARTFVRNIMMWADEVSLDGQGRITLPKALVEFAGIDDRAKIIGAFDHIEIWSPDVLEQQIDEQKDSYEEIAERVML